MNGFLLKNKFYIFISSPVKTNSKTFLFYWSNRNIYFKVFSLAYSALTKHVIVLTITNAVLRISPALYSLMFILKYLSEFQFNKKKKNVVNLTVQNIK